MVESLSQKFCHTRYFLVFPAFLATHRRRIRGSHRNIPNIIGAIDSGFQSHSLASLSSGSPYHSCSNQVDPTEAKLEENVSQSSDKPSVIYPAAVPIGRDDVGAKSALAKRSLATVVNLQRMFVVVVGVVSYPPDTIERAVCLW